MASADELRCMATLCANLNDAALELSGHQGASSTEQEALELLDLLPQILEAGPHPGRLSALLYQVEPSPLAVVCRLTHSQLAVSSRLRTIAAKTLTRVLGICLAPDCADFLAVKLRDSLRDLYLIPVLLSLITKGNPRSDASAAAELLFLVVMQLPSLRDELLQQYDGVAVLLTKLTDTDEPSLRSYVAATLRVAAQVNSDLFIARELQFFAVVSSVLREQNDAQTSVLLLEMLTDVVNHHASAYVSTVLSNEHLLDELTDGITSLLSLEGESAAVGDAAAAAELESAAIACVRAIMAIEGASDAPALRAPANRGIRGTFTHVTAWHKAVTAAAGFEHKATLLQLQRWLVATAVSRHQILSLHRPFMETFPTLCVLLNAEKSTPECMIEVAVIIALVSAKLLAVRRDIGELVKGYDAWATHLLTTVGACIRRAKTDGLLAGIFIVDEHQCLLNDGDLLTRVETLDAAGVVRALFSEQERRHRAAAQGGDSTVPLGPVRHDLHSPLTTLPSRNIEVAASMAATILERAAALSLTPAEVSATDAAMRGDATVIAAHLSHVAKRQMQGTAVDSEPSPATTSPRPGTPRRGGGGGQGNGSFNASSHADPNASLTPSRSRTPTTPAAARQDRVNKVARLFGTNPTKRQPFRPASPAATSRSRGIIAPIGSGGSAALLAQANPLVLHGAQQQQLLVEALQVRGDKGDEYMSMSIMMHLPIAFGVHYNRESRGAVRRIVAPNGNQYVQPVHRNTNHSWSILDVREGDAYVLFVPFHKLTVERMEAEIQAVERYLVSTKKQLVLTPAQQRSRRWFLHDMLNYVLPKTELMLRDMLQLLRQFSADNVVYQLGVIRLLDEGRREKQDVLQAALEESDSAMPMELLRLSSGRLKDILHSGNLSYAVRRLKEHFFTPETAGGHLGSPIAYRDDTMNDFGAPEQLATIDREIERLERQAMQDSWGKEAEAAAMDDVEPAYGHDLAGRAPRTRTDAAAAKLLDPRRYLDDEDAGGEEEDVATGAPPRQAPTPQQKAKAIAHWSNEADEPVPQHLQAAFERGHGYAEETDDMMPAPRPAAVPGLMDFDAMYAAVERSYNS